jgi:hypothetical protein
MDYALPVVTPCSFKLSTKVVLKTEPIRYHLQDRTQATTCILGEIQYRNRVLG